MSIPPPLTKHTVCLVGCGKMGSAMLRAWLSCDLFSSFLVIDPSPLPAGFQNDPRVTHVSAFPETALDFDVFVLAVKPQILKDSTAGLVGRLLPHSFVLSIAAGQSLYTLSAFFGADISVVRAMPNTPASIGKGMSVAVCSQNTSEAQKITANALLEAIGKVQWIDDETLMDAVTALSGSGPAYVFYVIETLAKAGEALGLSSDMAMALARQTVIGSAALAESEHNIAATILRENVTSPGGTTQAALEILMDGRLDDLFKDALRAAKQRSIALNK